MGSKNTPCHHILQISPSDKTKIYDHVVFKIGSRTRVKGYIFLTPIIVWCLARKRTRNKIRVYEYLTDIWTKIIQVELHLVKSDVIILLYIRPLLQTELGRWRLQQDTCLLLCSFLKSRSPGVSVTLLGKTEGSQILNWWKEGRGNKSEHWQISAHTSRILNSVRQLEVRASGTPGQQKAWGSTGHEFEPCIQV
jgi:hypothetical protein